MAEHSLGISLVPHFLAEGAVAKRRVVLWHQGSDAIRRRSYFMNIKQARRHEPQIRDFASWVQTDCEPGRVKQSYGSICPKDLHIAIVSWAHVDEI